jgi:hypothetical protein
MINDYRQSQPSKLPVLPWTDADYERAKGVAWDNANNKTGFDRAMHITRQNGHWGPLPVSGALTGWQNSPGHDAALLQNNWVSMALCVVVTVYPDGITDFVAICNFTRTS